MKTKINQIEYSFLFEGGFKPTEHAFYEDSELRSIIPTECLDKWAHTTPSGSIIDGAYHEIRIKIFDPTEEDIKNLLDYSLVWKLEYDLIKKD